MRITVETKHVPTVFDLKRDPPEGVEVRAPPVVLGRSLDSQELLVAVVSVAAGVPASLIANWLFEKLKKGKEHTKVRIRRKEI
jgi:hypothetical protein